MARGARRDDRGRARLARVRRVPGRLRGGAVYPCERRVSYECHGRCCGADCGSVNRYDDFATPGVAALATFFVTAIDAEVRTNTACSHREGKQPIARGISSRRRLRCAEKGVWHGAGR